MKATTSALIVAAALLATACGEGRAIFNLNVHSFIEGTGNDTIPYVIPAPGGSASTVQRVDLPPGFGSSIVESATIDTGAANLINSSGTGMIGFQLYIAVDSASTYLPAALAVNVDSTAVFPSTVSPLAISGGLTPAVLAVLNESQVWIRFVAKGTNADALNPVIGNMALTALTVRIVFQDKLF